MKKLFTRNSHKKASLEISVQAIVIVVLAMTLLGLGLGFVRNLFSDISGTTKDVQASVKERILDDLITNDKKLSFPKTEIKIDKGASEIISIGMRNKKDIPLKYYLDFKFISVPTNSDVKLDGTTDAQKTKNFIDGLNQETAQNALFQFDRDVSSLESAGTGVRNMRLNIPASVSIGPPDAVGANFEDVNVVSGSYALSFRIIEVLGNKDIVPTVTDEDGGTEVTKLDKVYEQKDLFIYVRT